MCPLERRLKKYDKCSVEFRFQINAMFSTHYWFCFIFLFLTAEASFNTSWNDVTQWQLKALRDGPCKTDLREYGKALTDLDTKDNLWAFQMLDASAKVPNGILELNTVQMGMFEECLAVEHPSTRFKGKHCMLNVWLSLPDGALKIRPTLLNVFAPMPERKPRDAPGISLKYGICIPSTCSAAELNEIFGEKGIITAYDKSCWTSDERPLSKLAIAFICVCAILAALAAASTCYNYLCVYRNRKPKRLLCAFSLYLNLPKLLEIRKNDGDNMDCLHGIRSMSMMWVVLCHSYEQQLENPLMNIRKLSTFMTSTDYLLVSNGYYSVDSFFFLSGLLVAFVFFRNIGKTGTYDAPTSYIHRFIRLTPPYAMIIFATVALLPDMGYGPLWHDTIDTLAMRCEDNWWTALLYIQNFAYSGGLCLGQSWYLSIDMQLFWIAPFIMYPIFLWPVYGTVFLSLLTVASTLWTFAIAYEKEYKASVYLNSDPTQFNYEYIVTHMRMMPYLVGMLCAVVVVGIKQRKIQVKISKPMNILGWCVSAGLCLGVLFSLHKFEIEPDISAAESALYLAFARLGWGLGLAWIVFACIYGYGGLANTVLSMGVWQPLGKLSYGVYLIHISILAYKTATLQTNILVTDLNVVYEYLATLVLSYLLAFLMYLTVEAPFMIIDQEILGSVHILQYPKPKPKPVLNDQLESGTAQQTN